MLPALLRMSLIQKALGYQPGAFVLSVVVVDNLPQSFPQCKSLKGLSCLTQKFRENFTQSNNIMWETTERFLPELRPRGQHL